MINLKRSGALSVGLLVLALCVVTFLPNRSLQAETATGPTGPTQATGPTTQEKGSRSDAQSKQDLPRVRINREGLSSEQFVARLLAEMSIEEKIGQLQQIHPEGDLLAEKVKETIATGGAGSLFFTGTEQLVHDAQRVAVEDSRLGIPLIIARDVIHGFRTVFPIPIGQASSWNPELVEQAAKVAANEASRVGIHWTFAPMVDIARDPRWGRIAESCGEDAVLASALGVAMVKGFQQPDEDGNLQGIAACPKHYVAYGRAEGGRDYNRVMVSRNELRNVYLKPFKGCIDAGAITIMSAFNTVNGVPATGHERLLREVLKDEWGFDGFVVSDWDSVKEMISHGYSADKRQAATQAMLAGLDMEMVSNCYQENLQQLVEEKTIDIAMVDDAVSRILLAKVKLGLFDKPYADTNQPELLCDAHLAVARELAQQSVVLLKNDGVLPLEKAALKKVAVIGPLADSPQDQLGTWTMDGLASDSRTSWAALQEMLHEGVQLTHTPCLQTKYREAPEEIATAVEAAKAADVVLLFVGEEEVLSGEAHSRSELSLPGSQGKLVHALAELETPVVMIVQAGRPLTIGKEIEAVDAVLYAWQQGTMAGPALADLLLGVVAPSGKLPVTFPKAVGQIPLYYNHMRTGRPSAADYTPPTLDKVKAMASSTRYSSHYIDSDPYPLFPFGFGLTYTQFEYRELEISNDSIGKDQVLVARVELKNTGNRAATEVVQLYTRDLVASTVRPVKELKQFRRVTLEPGEETIVELSLTYDSLGFYSEEEHYQVEPGKFEVSVGGSSATSLSKSFSVK
ncbi:beta-glucosidase BglX [Adhaeretor mobilis]|nr:beta-glucosidase BglX [Adhaeretor mobilis]